MGELDRHAVLAAAAEVRDEKLGRGSREDIQRRGSERMMEQAVVVDVVSRSCSGGECEWRRPEDQGGHD